MSISIYLYIHIGKYIPRKRTGGKGGDGGFVARHGGEARECRAAYHPQLHTCPRSGFSIVLYISNLGHAAPGVAVPVGKPYTLFTRVLCPGA